MRMHVINAQMLESWRIANAKSIEELARGIGVDRTSVLRILNGNTTRLRAKTYKGILDYTGLTPEQLLDESLDYQEITLDIHDLELLRKFIEAFGYPIMTKDIPVLLSMLRKLEANQKVSVKY